MSFQLDDGDFHIAGGSPEFTLLFQTLCAGFLKWLCNKMWECLLLRGRKDGFRSPETEN